MNIQRKNSAHHFRMQSEREQTWGIFFLWFIKLVMTSFTLNLISVKVSFHDIFKKTLNITPVNITSFTVVVISPYYGHLPGL